MYILSANTKHATIPRVIIAHLYALYRCAHVYLYTINTPSPTYHTEERRYRSNTCVRNISREDPLRQTTRGGLPSKSNRIRTNPNTAEF